MTKTVCHIENTERAMDGESMAVSKYGWISLPIIISLSCTPSFALTSYWLSLHPHSTAINIYIIKLIDIFLFILFIFLTLLSLYPTLLIISSLVNLITPKEIFTIFIPLVNSHILSKKEKVIHFNIYITL